MTNSERAENIVDVVYSLNATRASHITMVQAQLDEAVAEAKDSEWFHGHAAGFSQAREKAAGIVLEVKSNVPTVQELLELFAERIRGMSHE